LTGGLLLFEFLIALPGGGRKRGTAATARVTATKAETSTAIDRSSEVRPGYSPNARADEYFAVWRGERKGGKIGEEDGGKNLKVKG